MQLIIGIMGDIGIVIFGSWVLCNNEIHDIASICKYESPQCDDYCKHENQ